MAITKLLRLKGRNGQKTEAMSGALSDCLNYICDPEKTKSGSGKVLIYSNTGTTDPNLAAWTMYRNKEAFGRPASGKETAGFHYVFSPNPADHATPERTMEAAKAFAEKLLGDSRFYMIAIHTNTDAVHAHIVFDSVDRATGAIYHSPKGDWEKKVQPIANKVCKEFGLSQLKVEKAQETLPGAEEDEEEEKLKPITYSNNYRMDARDLEQNGYYGKPPFSNEEHWMPEYDDVCRAKGKKHLNWRDVLRHDIDSLIDKVDSLDELVEVLQKQFGYTVTRRTNEYLALQPYGTQRSIRTYRLGAAYDLEALQFRIENKQLARRRYPDGYALSRFDYASVLLYRSLRTYEEKTGKFTAYQKMTVHSYRLARTFLITPPAGRYYLRKTIMDMDQMLAASKYMFDNDITSEGEMENKYQALLKEKKAIQKEQRYFKKDLYTRKDLRELYRYCLIPENKNITRAGIEAYAEVKMGISKDAAKELTEEYLEAAGKVKGFTTALRDINREIRIVEGIQRKIVPDAKKDMFSSAEEPSEKRPYHAFTANYKLLKESQDKDKILIRLPYQMKKYLELDKKDLKQITDITYKFWIYDDAAYNIVSFEGAEPSTSKAGVEQVLQHFEDKTKKRESKQL